MRKEQLKIEQIDKKFSNLEYWGEKSCRSTDADVADMIVNLKKTIENQESKLKKLELLLTEHRRRMK